MQTLPDSALKEMPCALHGIIHSAISSKNRLHDFPHICTPPVLRCTSQSALSKLIF